MASAVATAQSAILTRFDTLWAGRTPVKWPRVAFTPPTAPAEPWAAIDIMWGDGFERSMGATNRNAMLGVIQVTGYHPRGEASGALNALLDAARDIFNRVSFSGVRCGVPSAPIQVDDSQWDASAIRVGFEIEETT